jgi:NOL1/NOP2/fmu family ribosome biogenesis protein
MYAANHLAHPQTKIALDKNQADEYVHGRELRLDHPDGYYWVEWNNTVLGPVKISQGRAVNKFPKPLRIV